MSIRIKIINSAGLPLSYTFIFTAAISLIGLPSISGYYSKEYILSSSYYVWFDLFLLYILNIAIHLTTYYSTKLILCFSYNRFYFFNNFVDFTLLDYFQPEKPYNIWIFIVLFLIMAWLVVYNQYFQVFQLLAPPTNYV